MEPRFKQLSFKELTAAVEQLVISLIHSIDEDDYTMNGDELCEYLEQFAGRDYIVSLKVEDELPLSSEDKRYIAQLLKNNANTVEL